ncbi:MAG TPA: hypothetical protein VEX62_04080 [Candidatus Limnocylindrales bacterium]|jgi:hypothetical protein|nr:hypothetical protein [Candidatus Limnocylindrales bacterium]
MAETATANHAGLRESWRALLAEVAVVTVTPFAGDELQHVE